MRGGLGGPSGPVRSTVALMGEIICTFNDALIRAEARMGADIEAGKAHEVRQYRLELRKGMAALRADVEAIIEFCEREVA